MRLLAVALRRNIIPAREQEAVQHVEDTEQRGRIETDWDRDDCRAGGDKRIHTLLAHTRTPDPAHRTRQRGSLDGMGGNADDRLHAHSDGCEILGCSKRMLTWFAFPAPPRN